MIQVDGQSKNKDVDRPPAYDNTPPLGHARIYSNAGAPAKELVHGPSFDQVHILDRKNEIRGTFYIDPSIPSLDPSRNRRESCKGKKKSKIPVHASFVARHKPIFLNLGTTGNIAGSPKANVLVSNKSCNIHINLLSSHPSVPRIGLEASSRKGNIVVYFPDDFQGVIHMETKRGSLKVLPVLQSRVKVANSSSQDVILMVDTPNAESNHCQETSFCHLSTRKGDVIVGLSNADNHSEPKGGIWQWIVGRMGALFS